MRGEERAGVFECYALQDGEGQLAVCLLYRREERGGDSLSLSWTNKTLANYPPAACLHSTVNIQTQYQCGPLSLVEDCRGSALIGQEDHSVAPPALLCHKEPAGLCLLLAGSLWHKG